MSVGVLFVIFLCAATLTVSNLLYSYYRAIQKRNERVQQLEDGLAAAAVRMPNEQNEMED